MTEKLDPAFLAPIEKVAQFIAQGDKTLLQSAFAKEGVVIVENFWPHLFEGADAVERWAEVITSWHEPKTDLLLKYKFGTPQDIRVHDDLAFVSLPTNWSGIRCGGPFTEDGGWAFILVKENDEWRIRSYGWAVTYQKDG